MVVFCGIYQVSPALLIYILRYEYMLFLLFVCLFVWGLLSNSRIVHLYGDVTITGEELKILTYARHSWPLSSEGSSACNIYCDTGHPFLIVISKDPWHSHLLPSV